MLIESEVFMGVVLKVREWFELMVSYVVKAVLSVLRVNAIVLRMYEGKPQARWNAGRKIACVHCGRLQDCLLVKRERAGCHGACDQPE